MDGSRLTAPFIVGGLVAWKPWLRAGGAPVTDTGRGSGTEDGLAMLCAAVSYGLVYARDSARFSAGEVAFESNVVSRDASFESSRTGGGGGGGGGVLTAVKLVLTAVNPPGAGVAEGGPVTPLISLLDMGLSCTRADSGPTLGVGER